MARLIRLGRIERAPLGDPCIVCRDRTHDRTYHGEGIQIGDRVMSLDEYLLMCDAAYEDDPPTRVRSIPT